MSKEDSKAKLKEVLSGLMMNQEDVTALTGRIDFLEAHIAQLIELMESVGNVEDLLDCIDYAKALTGQTPDPTTGH